MPDSVPVLFHGIFALGLLFICEISERKTKDALKGEMSVEKEKEDV